MTKDLLRQDLIEIAEAVVQMDRYESDGHSNDTLVLLEETAEKAREVLAAIKESTHG